MISIVATLAAAAVISLIVSALHSEWTCRRAAGVRAELGYSLAGKPIIVIADEDAERLRDWIDDFLRDFGVQIKSEYWEHTQECPCEACTARRKRP